MSTTTAPTKPWPLTLGQLADALDAHYEAEGRSDDYRSRQRRLVEGLAEIGVLGAAGLDDADLEERVLAARPEGESEGTRRGVVNHLRAALGRARKLRLIGPAAGDRRAGTPRRDLSPAEVEAYVGIR